MAFSEVTVGLLLILALANGQFSPNNQLPSCNDPSIQAGNQYLAHPNYCELYLQCDSGLNRNEVSCGPGTLFNTDTLTCGHPSQTKCSSWRCDRNSGPLRYPSVCCNKYYECNGAGFEERSCPSQQVFNPTSGTCGSGQCTNAPQCRPFGTVQTDAASNCYHRASRAGNPCTYDTIITQEITVNDRPCPYGTSYNASACQCSTLNPACPSTNNANLIKGPDPECKASFKVEFDGFRESTSAPLAVTDKIGNGNVNLPDMVQVSGGQMSNGVVNLARNPQTGAQPSVYIYSFNNNQLNGNVLITVAFRIAQGIQGAFQILSNNYNNACTATIEATATYSGGFLTVNSFATAFTPNGVNSQIVNSGNSTGSLSVQPGEWLYFTYKFYDGAHSFEMQNRGSNGNNLNGQGINSTVTQTLGSNLSYNKCGFNFLSGLIGAVDKIVVRENCLNRARANI